MAFTLETKNSSTPTMEELTPGFLAQENGDLLLQENGDAIIIEGETSYLSDFSLPSKNSSTPSFEAIS